MREHPEWFYRRPDGTLKYAENPPKKYQDIYPVNFACEAWESLWDELLRVVLFWVDQGVRTFRVDNPHTKPLEFWEWLIREVQDGHPDVIFLSEAFTRPKVMKALAKAGFSQSYTYFTWRNFKEELTEYFEELTRSEMAEYFRGNLFCNTPDILPEILQRGGPPAVQDAGRAGRDPLPTLGHLQRLRALRGRAHARDRGVPGLGEVPDPGAGLGPARPHQGATWPS